MPTFPYRTQAVRDLAWACFSPQLLRMQLAAGPGGGATDCALALSPARRRWLQQLDNDPAPLLAHLAANRSQRLGIYFEQLWHFFLARDAGVELLAHNLPVREAGRTLGEFDCIYWCHERQRHYHLELAVKFFLSYRQATTDAATSHWREWLGPNSKDRLDVKMDQLLRHQTRLGEHPRAREQLAALGVAELYPEIALKGYLFQGQADPLPPPTGFNPDHQLDQWLTLAGLRSQLKTLGLDAFLVLPKTRWLAPVVARVEEEVLGRSCLVNRLQSLFDANTPAALVAGLDKRGLETVRFFVTAEPWPRTQLIQENQ